MQLATFLQARVAGPRDAMAWVVEVVRRKRTARTEFLDEASALERDAGSWAPIVVHNHHMDIDSSRKYLVADGVGRRWCRTADERLGARESATL
jgi:hypothetical protein